MPQSLHSNFAHIVFSTKNREPMIGGKVAGRIHSYLAGIVQDQGAVLIAINGMPDHVHLLIGLRATHRLADVVRDIKAASSEWVHQEIRQAVFSWQEGYGAFTVSASQLDVVKQYIANQAEHHRKRSFQEEYREMLVKSGVEFDEKYLW